MVSYFGNLTAKNSISAYIAVLAKAGVGFGLGVFLARFFGPEEFGIYRSLLALVALGGVAAKLGLDEALVRYGSEFISKGVKGAYLRTLLEFSLLRTGASLLLCGVLWVAWPSIAGLVGALDVPVVTLNGALALIVASGLWQLLGTSNFAARRENYISDIAEAVRELAVLAGVVAGAMVLAWGVAEVLWFRAIALGAVTAYFIYLTGCGDIGGAAASEYRGSRRRIVRYAAWSYGATLAFGVPVFQIQQLIVVQQLGAEGAGIFGVGVLVVGLLVILNPARVLRRVIEPKLVGRYLQVGDVTVLHDAFSVLTRMALVVSVPFAIAMISFADTMFAVTFGQQYAAGAYVATLLAIGQVAFSACAAYAPILSVLERKEVVTIAGIFPAINILLSIALIRWFGLEGIGVALVLTGVGLWAYYYAVVSWLVRKPLRMEGALLGKVLINSAPLGFWAVLDTWIDLPVGQEIAVAGFTGMLCMLLMVVNCPVLPEERTRLREAFRQSADNGAA